MKDKEFIEAFQGHVRSAKRRGVAFLLTFEEWRDWWLLDDRWSNRGRRAHNFVMARTGDVGPYALSNIYCATQSQNLLDVPTSVRCHAGHQADMTKKAKGGAYTHLRSETHPRNAALRSPDGEFVSIEAAAKHYGVTGRCIRYRLQSWEGWHRAA